MQSVSRHRQSGATIHGIHPLTSLVILVLHHASAVACKSAVTTALARAFRAWELFRIQRSSHSFESNDMTSRYTLHVMQAFSSQPSAADSSTTTLHCRMLQPCAISHARQQTCVCDPITRRGAALIRSRLGIAVYFPRLRKWRRAQASQVLVYQITQCSCSNLLRYMQSGASVCLCRCHSR
jgi:hypothetical protein